MITVKLVRRNEEEVSLYVNDEKITTVTYDQVGWSGIEAFESGIQGLVSSLIEHLGPNAQTIEFVEDETFGDEDDE